MLPPTRNPPKARAELISTCRRSSPMRIKCHAALATSPGLGRTREDTPPPAVATCHTTRMRTGTTAGRSPSRRLEGLASARSGGRSDAPPSARRTGAEETGIRPRSDSRETSRGAVAVTLRCLPYGTFICNRSPGRPSRPGPGSGFTSSPRIRQDPCLDREIRPQEVLVAKEGPCTLEEREAFRRERLGMKDRERVRRLDHLQR